MRILIKNRKHPNDFTNLVKALDVLIDAVYINFEFKKILIWLLKILK